MSPFGVSATLPNTAVPGKPIGLLGFPSTSRYPDTVYSNTLSCFNPPAAPTVYTFEPNSLLLILTKLS